MTAVIKKYYFVDDDGSAVLTYWEYTATRRDDSQAFIDRELGIGIATSTDEHFDSWTKSEANPVIRSTDWGITEINQPEGEKLIYGSADPSQIWKKEGKYLALRKPTGTRWCGKYSKGI